MGTRVFASQKGFDLVSDERDIMLPMDLTKQVLEWCEINNITVEQNHQIILQTAFGVTLWRVKDDKQRMWFRLRWG
jgi:hypothetical protein